MIYHVTERVNWEQALRKGSYEAASLTIEGFIHTSSAEQVKGVMERYYKGRSGLILLHIDETKLHSPLQYELALSVNEAFPHIYGPLNTDAVVKTEVL